jgi:hypothetical protein
LPPILANNTKNMSLPAPPATPAIPTYQTIQPAPIQPSQPTIIGYPAYPAPSTSSSDLSSTSNSTQNNSNLTQNKISNINVTNQSLQGSDIQVGNIKLQTAAFYINGSYSPHYGESVISGGVVVPLGGRTAYRSAMRISESEADGAIGNVCVSIFKNRMTEAMVKGLYGKRSDRYLHCVDPTPAASKTTLLTEKAQATASDRDDIIAELRAEIQQMREELAAARATRALPMPPSNAGVPGLW